MREAINRAVGLLSDPVHGIRKIGRWLRPMPAEYRRRYKMTLARWLLYHQKNIAFDQCRWMGLPAIKNPLDAWIYQEIIHEVKPDVIIEIGSAKGGSTLYFAHLLDLLGKGQVVSVDVDRSGFLAVHPRIVVLTGDSSSEAIVGRVKELCRDKSVFIIHDGEHTKEQVLKDLNAYSNLVSRGSYFVVEDGIVDLFHPGDGLGWFREGPLRAIDQFVREHPEFIIDSTRERYLITYNPHGYLKRVG